MRAAHASRVSGIPPAELLDIRRERRGVNRREFLSAAAAATAVVGMSGCRSVLSTPDSTEEVLVVGAGIAGLTAAYRLEQNGVRVRIIEAQNRVGGRMFSLRGFFPEGQVAELGGELIDSGHTAIRDLASELGIPLDDLDQDDPALARDVWFFDGQRRTEREVVEAFLPISASMERDLAILEGDGDVTFSAPNRGERLDHLSIRQWLDAEGVRGWIRELLDVGYTTEFGLEPEDQSSLNLLTMIDTKAPPFRIFGESDERYHVRGGNDLIVQELAGRISADPELNTRLEAIDEQPDGSIRCSVQQGTVSRTITAPRVIITIPFTMLREVPISVELSPAKKRAIRELGYGTNAKLMAGFSDRVWREQGSNGSVLTDLPFQLCWETSRMQAGKSGILTNFTGGRHGVEIGQGTDREQAARLVQSLDGIFRGVAEAHEGMKSVRMHWPTHPFVRGSYASYKVGQWTGFRGAEGEPAGRLHFAGEHCSLESQGFMNGGCETGERAAREVLEAMGRAVARAA